MRRHAGARLEPYQNDHEDANGQFEMNWEFDDALATADKHSFFKFHASSRLPRTWPCAPPSCPKPFKSLTGNGCHCHISVWDLDGRTNAFADGNAQFGLSRKGAISSAASSGMHPHWRR